MSVCTGEFKIVYPLTAYAEADTYYTTTPLTLYRGADSIRLTLTNTVANAGNVTIKAQILQGDGVTYADYGNTMVVAMTTAIVQSVVLPFRFVTGDMVRISFKASSVASSPKLQIDALAYLDGTDYRNSEIPQTITTVADTPNPITAQSRNKTNIYGSASNSKMVLPSGLTVTNDWTHTFWNLSSEFVPVTDYDGTLQAMVGPGCKLECVLKTAGTAAGVWVCEKTEPRGYHRSVTDFDKTAGTSTSIPDVYTYVGTGSSAQAASSGGFGQWGSALCIMGTDAGLAGFVNCVYGALSAANEVYLNYNKPIFYQAELHQLTRSDATNDTKIRFGFINNVTGAQPTDGVYLQTNSTDEISGITRASSSETVVAGTTQLKLSAGKVNSVLAFVTNAAATRVDFWVDNTYLGASSLTIPKTALLNAGWQFSRVAGVANNRIYVDRLTMERPE